MLEGYPFIFQMNDCSYEPRKIVSTVLNIMLDVYKNDERASF